MRILAVEPYFGGSHKAFLDGVVRHSRHDWNLLTAPAIHWKWRMRSSPLALAKKLETTQGFAPQILFCSDMLDLTSWLGLVTRSCPAIDWRSIPIVTYFHENQWTYPTSPKARVDFHYGYTNLLTAFASNANWFNSSFHMESFLSASEAFVRRMPDDKAAHDFDAMRSRCKVLSPGYDPPGEMPRPQNESSQPLVIGWVSRWEYDKRPDQFLELLRQLNSEQVPFQLVLLGPRGDSSEHLNAIRTEFGHQIALDEYANSQEEYWSALRRMDVVVSTADHEFFGIAICEAIHAGAVPVLPDRLSYPELAAKEFLYSDLDDATNRIKRLADPDVRSRASKSAIDGIQKYQMVKTVVSIDDGLEAFLDKGQPSC